MRRVAVLLRGVNVGGRNRIAMADLRAVLGGLGCTDVSTYLQSGNAVATADPAELAQRVEQALQAELGLSVAVLVRTADELHAVVAGNPFDPDPKLLHAVFLSADLEPGVVVPQELLPDRVEAGDRVLYVRYAEASHDSRASKLLSSKRFPVVASARNWRTVLALQELVSA
jgi:uncharacterized protein (DUF1697 family)